MSNGNGSRDAAFLCESDAKAAADAAAAQAAALRTAAEAAKKQPSWLNSEWVLISGIIIGVVCLIFFLSCIVICYYNGKSSDKQLRHLLPYVSTDFEGITKDAAKDKEGEEEKIALAKGLVSTMAIGDLGTLKTCDFGSAIGGEMGSVMAVGDNAAKREKEDEKNEQEIIEGFASVFLQGKQETNGADDGENERGDEIMPSSERQGKQRVDQSAEARTGKGAEGENRDDEITKMEEENVTKDKLMKEKTKIKKIMEEGGGGEMGKLVEEKWETEREREENEFGNDKRTENQSWKWKPKNSAKKRKIEGKANVGFDEVETFEGEEEDEKKEKKKEEVENVGMKDVKKEREKGKEYEARNKEKGKEYDDETKKEKGKEYDGNNKEEKEKERQCLHNTPAFRKNGKEEKELGSSSCSAPSTPILGEKRNRRCKICDKCKKCQQERSEIKQQKEQRRTEGEQIKKQLNERGTQIHGNDKKE